jgi:hypothetical protein
LEGGFSVGADEVVGTGLNDPGFGVTGAEVVLTVLAAKLKLAAAEVEAVPPRP